MLEQTHFHQVPVNLLYISLRLSVCLLPMGGQTRDFWEGERVLMVGTWYVDGHGLLLFQSDVYFLSYMRKYAKKHQFFKMTGQRRVPR